jgi:uncharacterized protein YkwD
MKKIIITFLTLVGAVSIFLAIFVAIAIIKSPSISQQPIPTHSFSGQELFNGVNAYRISKDLPQLKENGELCNNLVERWLDIKNPDNGHEGFVEWATNKKLLIKGYPNKNFHYIGELYIVDASTVDMAIEWWASSPGHRIALENPDFDVMCTYAAEGAGVVVVGDLVN